MDVPCCNLTDDGGCGVWRARPQPCRDYPVGGPACRRAIERQRVTTKTKLYAMLDEWSASRSPSGTSGS
jgi:hypothetical protein